MLHKTLVWMTLLAVMSLGMASAQARKQTRRPGKLVPVVLLPVKAKGIEGQRARKLAKELASAMVEELRDIGIFDALVGKKTKATMKKLRKKKVYVRNCQDDKKCLRAVGKALRAKVIYHMELNKVDAGVEVTLRTFDVRSGKKLREATALTRGDDAELERQARWIARKVSSPMITTVFRKQGKGRFKIEGTDTDAELIINGKSYGKRMGKSFKVTAGVFDVVVRKKGFEDFHDVIVVKPRQEKVVKAVLKPVDKADSPVVAAAGGETAASKTKPKVELPAWAAFGKPDEGKSAADKTEAATGSLAKSETKSETKPAPFLPETRPQPAAKAEDDEGGAFYTTWWFWTAVGVGVAGAAAAVTVVALTGGESTPGSGGAVLQWQ